jgi:hypothetical protein
MTLVMQLSLILNPMHHHYYHCVDCLHTKAVVLFEGVFLSPISLATSMEGSTKLSRTLAQ